MVLEEKQEQFNEMAHQAEAIEKACASEHPAHVPNPEQSFYLMDVHLPAKKVIIGLCLFIAFVVAEFAFNLL